MANANRFSNLRRLHVSKLREGVEAWNQWRTENAGVRPLLSGTSLGTLNLADANLSAALMRGADLNHADLRRANLEHADLHAASLLNVFMPHAKLHHVNLSAANVNGDLRWVDLTSAHLYGTQVYGSMLAGADFDDADCGSTVFAAVDLSTCKNLRDVNHHGPSTIGIDTIYYSHGRIPGAFLEGAGLPKPFIAGIPALIEAGSPTEFYSCFISYSHRNADFARRLHERLRDHGIRCWRDEDQLLPGDDFPAAIDRGIQRWDKVLLCCSKESMTSGWVEREIAAALEKERELTKERGQKVESVIPIDLDGYILTDEWKSPYRAEIDRRLASDFAGCGTNKPKFDAQLEKLIQALRADTAAREKPPVRKL